MTQASKDKFASRLPIISMCFTVLLTVSSWAWFAGTAKHQMETNTRQIAENKRGVELVKAGTVTKEDMKEIRTRLRQIGDDVSFLKGRQLPK